MNYTMTVYFETEEFANAQNAILHFQLNISHQIKIKTLTNCNVCLLKNYYQKVKVEEYSFSINSARRFILLRGHSLMTSR